MKEKTLRCKIDIERDLLKDLMDFDEQAMYVVFSILNKEIEENLEKKNRHISKCKVPASITIEIFTEDKPR